MYSLDDLRDRARLAVPDLDIAELEISHSADGTYNLCTTWGVPGFGFVFVGILRAMADDYGDLVFLDHLGLDGKSENLRITLLETAFAQGREFDLSGAQSAVHDA